MNNNYDHNSILNIYLTEFSTPLSFYIPLNYSPYSLLSEILTIFGYTPDTEIFLQRIEKLEEIINLSVIEKIDNKILSGNFYIKFEKKNINIKDFYLELINEEKDENIENLIKKYFSKFQNYLLNYLKEQFLLITLKDLINNNKNIITDSIYEWINIYDSYIIINTYVELISNEFADNYLWSDQIIEKNLQNKLNIKNPILNSILLSLTKIIITHSCFSSVPQSIFDLFYPSYFSYLLFEIFLNLILNKIKENEYFNNFIYLFSNYFIYKIFNQNIKNFNEKILINYFPFVFIRLKIENLLNKLINPYELIEIFESLFTLNILLSKKFISIIIKSFFIKIDLINPYFRNINLTKNHNDLIIELINFIEPFLLNFLSKNQNLQLILINCLQNYFLKNNNYPKGLIHIIFSKFFSLNIISSNSILKWLQKPIDSHLNLDSILIEISGILISLISPL